MKSLLRFLFLKTLGILALIVILPLVGCSDDASKVKAGPERPAAVKERPQATNITINYAEELGDRPEQLWPDPLLKRAFAHYWGNRFSGTPKEGFALEAPYFQEMVSEDFYRRYVQNAVQNKLISINLLGLDKEGEQLCALNCKMLIELPNGNKEEVSIKDRWVFAGERWYHVIRDQFFFPL